MGSRRDDECWRYLSTERRDPAGVAVTIHEGIGAAADEMRVARSACPVPREGLLELADRSAHPRWLVRLAAAPPEVLLSTPACEAA